MFRYVVGENWRYSERGVHHVGAVAEKVSLIQAYFRIEVVFVTETETAATGEIRYLKVKIAVAPTAVELETGTRVNVKREIAGEGFQEGLVQRWPFGLRFFALRVSQDASIEDGVARGSLCLRHFANRLSRRQV